jgi:hypothetical protein
MPEQQASHAHLHAADAKAQGSLTGHDQLHPLSQQIWHQILHRNGHEVFA